MKQADIPENTSQSSNLDNSENRETIYPLIHLLFHADQILQH